MQHFAGYLRLLVDFFDHKVVEAAFLNGIHLFSDQFRFTLDEAAILDRVQLHPVSPQGDDLTVVGTDDLARERKNGGQIGREAGKAFSDAHHQPGAFFDGIQLVVIDAPDDKGVIALQVVVCQADGFDEIMPLVDVAFHGMHTGFAVVLGAHGHAFSHELLAQFDIVDHVAIMCTDDVAIRIEVRLRVHLGRFAKSCPAQLGNTALPGHFRQVVFLCYFIHAPVILAQVNVYCR